MKKILFLSTLLLLSSITDCYAGPWEIAVIKVQAGKADWDSFTASGEYQKARGALGSSRKTSDIIAGLTEAYDNWKSSLSFSTSRTGSVFSGFPSTPPSPTSSVRSVTSLRSATSSMFSPGSSVSISTVNPEIARLEAEVEAWNDEVEKLEDDEDTNAAAIKSLRQKIRATRARIKDLKKSGGGSGAGAGAGGGGVHTVPDDSFSKEAPDGTIYYIPSSQEEIKTTFNGKTAKQLIMMIKMGTITSDAMLQAVKKALQDAGVKLGIIKPEAEAGDAGGSPVPAPVDSPYSVKSNGKIYSVPEGTDLEKKIRAGMTEKSVKEVLVMVKMGSPLGLRSLEAAGIKVTVTDASTAPVAHGSPPVPTEIEMGEYELLKGFVTIQIPRGMDVGKLISGVSIRGRSKVSEIKSLLADLFNQGAEEESYTEAKKVAEAIVADLKTKGNPTAKVKVNNLVIVPPFSFIDSTQKDMLVGSEPASAILEKLSRNRNPKPAVAQGLIDRLKASGIEIQLNPEVFPLVREGFVVRSVAPLGTEIMVNGSLMAVRAALSKITTTNVNLASYIEALRSVGITIELPTGLDMEALKKHAEAVAAQEAKKEQEERERKAKAALEAAKKEFASNKAELGSDINTYDLRADAPIRLSGSETLGEITAALARGKKSTDPMVRALYEHNRAAAQAAIDKYKSEHP